MIPSCPKRAGFGPFALFYGVMLPPLLLLLLLLMRASFPSPNFTQFVVDHVHVLGAFWFAFLVAESFSINQSAFGTNVSRVVNLDAVLL